MPGPAISASEATTILLAATATGPGKGFSVPQRPAGGVTPTLTWQTILNGAPATVGINLEASLDGTHWTSLDTAANTAGEIRYVVGIPVTLVRANLTALTGGTAPSVTVIVQPGE